MLALTRKGLSTIAATRLLGDVFCQLLLGHYALDTAQHTVAADGLLCDGRICRGGVSAEKRRILRSMTSPGKNICRLEFAA
jgi:hypothetical protein